jgi:predicted O-methyltransferase YrrM
MQEPDEIAAFARFLDQQSTSTVVEIGTKNGGTLYIWLRHLEPDRIASIDVDPSFPERAQLFARFSDATARFLNSRSQRPETVQSVSEFVAEDGIDLLFIDGDHRYEAAKADFETYLPFVNDGGIIAFHDIVEVDKEIMGVPRLWSEVKEQYPSQEIIVPPDKGRGGIGVLKKSG